MLSRPKRILRALLYFPILELTFDKILRKIINVTHKSTASLELTSDWMNNLLLHSRTNGRFPLHCLQILLDFTSYIMITFSKRIQIQFENITKHTFSHTYGAWTSNKPQQCSLKSSYFIEAWYSKFSLSFRENYNFKFSRFTSNSSLTGK